MTECAECNLLYRLGVVCSFVCVCGKAPNIGEKGTRLKQLCVDQGLNSMKNAGVLPGVHPEMGWLMSSPPQALTMGKGTEAHKFGGMIGKARKLLGKNKAEALGKGKFRIPDVTMVPNPSQPASAANLQALVEIKFKGDTWSEGQKIAYQEIADDKPLILMGDPDHKTDAETFCKCKGKEQQQYQPEGQPAPQPALRWDEQGRPDTYPLPDEPITAPSGGWGKVGAALGLVATGAALLWLVGNDVTGIGAADDVAIPPVAAAFAGFAATLGLASSATASEGLKQSFSE